MSEDGLLEIRDYPAWLLRGYWGADCRSVGDSARLEALVAPFAGLMRMKGEIQLFDWWTAKAVACGKVPEFDPRWWSALSDIADRICVRERSLDGQHLRTRYMGAGIEERIRVVVPPGEDASLVSGESEAAFLDRLKLLFEEGRPRFMECRYDFGDGLQRFRQLDLPLRAPGSAEIRFSIGSADFTA